MRLVVKAIGIYLTLGLEVAGDGSHISGKLAGAQMSSAQMAVAAKMVRMNADNAASIIEVLNAAQRNIASLANVAAGVGQNLNITA